MCTKNTTQCFLFMYLAYFQFILVFKLKNYCINLYPNTLPKKKIETKRSLNKYIHNHIIIQKPGFQKVQKN